MNTVVTSKDEILKNSRKLIQQQGWSAVSIRSVAAASGVSVGSIYNYFGSKAELVNAAVESVWHEIFHLPQEPMVFRDTLSCISWFYERMEYGSKKYPGFFTLHSFSFAGAEKAEGKKLMYQTWKHIQDNLCSVLEHDPNVRPDAFGGQFTAEKFADALFSLILSSLLRQDYDPFFVLEIIRRTLYQ
ncbi:MAG: TetR/AcrR family transcriptional regulator [Ruminococcus sp.]